MTLSFDNEDDGKYMVNVAKRVRRDLFKEKKPFDGRFDKESQQKSVPNSLLMLLQMILEGTNIIASNNDNKTRDIALQIAQLVKFNAIKKVRESNVKNIRHSEIQETALPVYTGQLVHSQTRKKSIIDKLYSLGLSISYNRVDEIQSAMAEQACDQYRDEGLVCPPSLKRQMFTTAAIDNVDHNSTSNTSKSHFHGTSISLFQHPDVYTTSKHMNFH